MKYPFKYTICLTGLFFFTSLIALAQNRDIVLTRGSIPEELLRPRRGESPRYPVDTVIGELGRGEAPVDAYSFANRIASGFISGEMTHPALAGINASLRENYLSLLRAVESESYRIGSGKGEPDGSVSFLIRFIGREFGITGELFIRYVTRQTEEEADGEINIIITGNWTFEEMILDEAKTRDEEKRELQRFDFSPYERFF
ncbi:MAG: hypothetical protein FWC03_05115 [Treponema sp.]|nr:hypothetical protein [Treponema sp.]